MDTLYAATLSIPGAFSAMMQQYALIFRCDATPAIGIGHVKRCLALAMWAQRAGWQCCMVSRFITDALQQELAQLSVRLLRLPSVDGTPRAGIDAATPYDQWLGVPWQVDAEQTIAALSEAGVSGIVVVDHYGIDARWEGAVRRVAARVVVIDDLANRAHDCDVLLDQTLGRNAAAYQNLVPPNCTLLLGTDYALLRPEFAAHRAQAMQRRAATTRMQRVFLSMGGTDALNLTEPILRALADEFHDEGLAVDVVLSQHAPHYHRVLDAAAASPLTIKVHTDASNVAQLMVEADIAIGAAGTMSWERACLGLPTVMVVTAENQREIGRALGLTDAARLLGGVAEVSAQDMARSVRDLVRNFDQWRRAVAAAFAVCDGSGARRVMSVLRSDGGSD